MKNFELIKKYHEGKLSKTELQSFEQKLKNDSEFKIQVEEHLELLDGFEGMKISKFETKLKDWSKGFSLQAVEVKKEKAKIVAWHKPVLTIVASISILLLGFLLWNYPSNNSLTVFQEKSYVVPLFKNSERSSSNKLTLFLLANNDFENQNYSACIKKLNQFTKTDSLFIPAQYLKGHAAFKNGAYDKSIQILNKVLTNSKLNNFKEINIENVEWTILLASLKKYLNNKSAIEKTKLLTATNSFLQRAKPSDTYFAKAQELKKLLE